MSFLRSLLFVLLILLFAIGGGYWLWSATRPSEPLSLELQTPKLSMEQLAPGLRSKPLFFTLAAVPYIKEHWQDWSGAFGLPTPLPEEIAIQCEATLNSPKDWRILDRKWRFGALLLTGDPAGFRPLLDHLRKSPDWTLTRLDPTSLVFERSPARAWTPSDTTALLEVFQTHSAEEQKIARTAIAHRLIYLKEVPAAQKLLEKLLQKEPQYKQAWTELAQLHGMQGQWEESVKAAEHALGVDQRYRPAQVALAEALYSLGRFDKALALTRALYEAAPADSAILMLHAKVSHAAHDFAHEIEVLQRMISLLQGNGQPVGSWQIYLGQAYAATGNSAMAEDQFKAALKDATLVESQRGFAQKALEQIAAKPDLLNSGPSFPPSSLLDAPEVHP
ncbi:MAG: tetratricopeptide repeat protein [Verrucomicrobia bacterium]|nr:tetratricopeptide repeat protein [Verrucomicrobiota bacterium]